MVRATLPKPDLLKIRRYAAGKVPVHLHDQIRIEVDTRGRSVTVVECRSPPCQGDVRPLVLL